jgi:DNA-binding XRE family transcriptional regulator
MHHAHRTLAQNELWIARKQVGYSQKWVAALLGHHSLSVVSEYEHGRKVPSLETALKLQAILHQPVAQLFPALTARVERDVAGVKSRHPAIRRTDERMAAVREMQHTGPTTGPAAESSMATAHV